MTFRETLYVFLALLGLAGTWYFNVVYVGGGGDLLDVATALKLAFANPIASSFSTDLLVSFTVFIVWSIDEARRIEMKRGWLYPLLGLFVGFAFAFPLFLFVRERHLRKRSRG